MAGISQRASEMFQPSSEHSFPKQGLAALVQDLDGAGAPMNARTVNVVGCADDSRDLFEDAVDEVGPSIRDDPLRRAKDGNPVEEAGGCVVGSAGVMKR